MEEIRLYIESGVLELCAAGGLKPEEREEVEAMLLKHPILKSELDEIEKSLEKYAQAYALKPSENLREKILGNLLAVHENTINQSLPSEQKIIALPSAKENPFYKYAFAASVALLIMSIAALVVMNSRLRETNQQLAVLQGSNQQFSNQVNYLNDQLSSSDVALGVLRNPEFKMVKLAGTKQAPQASMMIAFNPVQKEVMIDMASMKMPANDAEHQYQLWALVDGKPVDLGVFDMNADDDGMVRMKAIENAQAFAVTLERRGGSPVPTMEQMMVLGTI